MICWGKLQRRIVLRALAHAARPAVSMPDGRFMRYGELLLRATDIALRFPGPLDRPVVLCFPKGPGLVAHIAGVLLAGGSCLSIDPSGMDASWQCFLEEAQLRLLIHAGKRPAGIEAVQGLATQRAFSMRRAWFIGDWRTVPAGHAGLAAMSSGTSGRPCGRFLPARSLLRATDAVVHHEGIHSQSRLSWIAPTERAASKSHLLAALASGACLCPFEPAADGLGAMSSWLAAQRVTHLHCTPSLLRAWLETLTRPTELPALVCVKVGGEPARAADFHALREKLGSRVRFLHGLGISEAVGNVACAEITGSDAARQDVLPVGWPVAGRRVRVVGASGEDLPAGVRGEIVVEDEWVSPGFGPPWPVVGNAALGSVRTGDAGCWDADGRLFHLGRLDRCVRVRGTSVDLADLEARISSFANVRDVAAVGEPDGYRLAVVLDPDSPAAREHFTGMVRTCIAIAPRRVAFFPELPMRRSGKRDDAEILRRWPAPVPCPGGPSERVRSAWRQALGHAEFGPDDTFEAAGGDSLAGMKLAAALGMPGLHAVQRLGTVRAMAAALETGWIPCGMGEGGATAMSWFTLGGSEARHAIAFIPGGNFSDAEAWLAGSLFHPVSEDRLLLVARLNPGRSGTGGALDFATVAAGLRPTLLGIDRPLLFGLCTGSALTLHLARELEEAGWPCERVVLLDPWAPGMPANPQPVERPPSVAGLAELLKSSAMPEVSCPLDVVIASDDPRAPQRLAFWQAHAKGALRIHHVAGDHISFVRHKRSGTQRAIAELLAAASSLGNASL